MSHTSTSSQNNIKNHSSTSPQDNSLNYSSTSSQDNSSTSSQDNSLNHSSTSPQDNSLNYSMFNNYISLLMRNPLKRTKCLEYLLYKKDIICDILFLRQLVVKNFVNFKDIGFKLLESIEPGIMHNINSDTLELKPDVSNISANGLFLLKCIYFLMEVHTKNSDEIIEASEELISKCEDKIFILCNYPKDSLIPCEISDDDIRLAIKYGSENLLQTGSNLNEFKKELIDSLVLPIGVRNTNQVITYNIKDFEYCLEQNLEDYDDSNDCESENEFHKYLEEERDIFICKLYYQTCEISRPYFEVVLRKDHQHILDMLDCYPNVKKRIILQRLTIVNHANQKQPVKPSESPNYLANIARELHVPNFINKSNTELLQSIAEVVQKIFEIGEKNYVHHIAEHNRRKILSLMYNLEEELLENKYPLKDKLNTDEDEDSKKPELDHKGVLTFYSEKDTLFNSVFEFSSFDNIALRNKNHVAVFTRPEFLNLIKTRKNHWNRQMLPLSIMDDLQNKIRTLKPSRNT
jgi:hypothetical protein